MKKAIIGVFALIFLTIFAVSSWKVFTIVKEYRDGTNTYDALEQHISFEKPEPTEQAQEPEVMQTEAAEPVETEPPVVDDTLWPQIDFVALAEINPDVIGWIYLEDTEINYPVVQGPDNSYYLNRLFDGTVNRAGSIYLDVDNTADFTDRNSVVYGHHLKNGTMFTDLMGYKKQEFYDGHPTALLVTPERKYKLHFFSGYVASVSASAWDMEFTDEAYGAWLSELVEKSDFEPGIMPAISDRVMTLSTCTYEFSNARYVMHGVLQDCGEN